MTMTPEQLDKKVDELSEKLEARKKKFAETKKSVGKWKTSCVFVSNATKYNLQVVTNLEQLIDWYAATKELIGSRSQVCDLLQIEDCPLELNGYPLIDWVHDIANRIQQLQLKQEEARIKEVETKLFSLRSEQQKRLAGLQELEDLL